MSKVLLPSKAGKKRHNIFSPQDKHLSSVDVKLFLAVFLQVILYSGDRAYENYYDPMKGRVHFNSADPKNGDASIVLTGLKSSDSGTYQCKVKKAPGIRSKKMQLLVLGELHTSLNTSGWSPRLGLDEGNALNQQWSLSIHLFYNYS